MRASRCSRLGGATPSAAYGLPPGFTLRLSALRSGGEDCSHQILWHAIRQHLWILADGPPHGDRLLVGGQVIPAIRAQFQVKVER